MVGTAICPAAFEALEGLKGVPEEPEAVGEAA
jgi:hypothetical protein